MRLTSYRHWLAASIVLLAGTGHPCVWAEDTTANVSTGITTNSVVGNNSQQATDTGVAINGAVRDSNVNNNQNRNSNVVQPIVLTQTQPQYMSSGRGGSAALVLPRNPLSLPNAAMGRSNFGLQFGVQNNPGISALTGGQESGLGWFMQGGVTIPFGKIPNVMNTPQNREYDEMRQERLDHQRQVFGDRVTPEQREAKVQGKVVSLNAYNYGTVSSDKLPLKAPVNVGEIVLPQPKVLALKPTGAFDQPLNTGEQIGEIQVGKEYPYLGHTRSGWVKLLLPNGKEAWAISNFEYIKFDYTEIDSLATDPVYTKKSRSSASSPAKESDLTKRRS